jgi:hypothetical protein
MVLSLQPRHTPHHHFGLVVFHEDTPGFGTSTPIDSVIIDASDTTKDHDSSPHSHPHTMDVDDTPNPPISPRSLRGMVAHLSDYPPARVTSCCDPGQGKAKRGHFRAAERGQHDHWPHISTSGHVGQHYCYVVRHIMCRAHVVPCCPLQCPSTWLARNDAT